ncbi:MAG: prepilin-type N-terminal cleavage/methylation domain-containing protein [Candidatus Eisenbacteria bacterium]|nr:prepilin-type N-terminal cleavage/methylation domain-containing protein [Candidatus Eisenbacteria bacterium]
MEGTRVKMFRRKKSEKGFTMIELMVVVVIVGILSSIAIPIYGKYVKNARITEATGRIGEIITAAKARAVENPNASGVPMWPTAAGGIVDLTATENFTYGIAATNPADTGTFTCTATGRARMAGVVVVMRVVGIASNGSAPVVTGL